MHGLTGAERKALRALQLAGDVELSVGEVGRRSGVDGQRIGLTLRALARAGLALERWERPGESASRWNRHLYRVTEVGRVVARTADGAPRSRGEALEWLLGQCLDTARVIQEQGHVDATAVSLSLGSAARVFGEVAARCDGDDELVMRFRALGRVCTETAGRWATLAGSTSHDRDLAWRTLRGVVAVLHRLLEESPHL